MKNTILVVYSLCLLLISNTVFASESRHQDSSRLVIGTVEIAKDSKGVTFKSGSFKFQNEFSDSSMEYTFVVVSSYIQYAVEDGVILPTSKGLRPFPVKSALTQEDFQLFAFFDEKPTCIGVLTGSAGASGGSGQQITIFDTRSTRHIQFETDDGVSPEWISENGHPVAFLNKILGLYIGSHAGMLGARERLEGYYRFGQDKLIKDIESTKRLIQPQYNEVVFTKEELNQLQGDDIYEIDRDLAVKLIDKVYYGLQLGKKDEVKHFLSQIHPRYRDELNWLIEGS